MFKKSDRILLVVMCLLAAGCVPFAADPVPGPDKQGAGMVAGAAAGATVGAQITAGTGPGIWTGMGLGALYGMISGIGKDIDEETLIGQREQLEYLREVSWADEVLRQHYVRKMTLFPNRDIFPADLFFCSDSSELKPEAKILVREIALLTKQRIPSSRIVIASYVTSNDPQSNYAGYISRKRADEIALHFIRAGVEARRVLTQPVILPYPLVLDPEDSPFRYRQAIEIVAADR